MNDQQKNAVKKINIICSKGRLEDIYPALILGNGAVMEGIACNIFFTFYGLDAIIKSRMEKLHTAVVGNPALRLPGGMRLPAFIGIIPGVETLISGMMKRRMENLDIPPISEFFDMITAGGGKIYACKTAVDMFRIREEELCSQVSGIITVGEFYSLSGGEGSHIIYT